MASVEFNLLCAFEVHSVETIRDILDDFHTVNSNDNRSAPLLHMVLDAGAKADVRLPGITWGRGFEWETTCFDVTPVSYAQLGLLPQMHRREADIYANVARLLAAAGRAIPPLDNVPNRYLNS